MTADVRSQQSRVEEIETFVVSHADWSLELPFWSVYSVQTQVQ